MKATFFYVCMFLLFTACSLEEAGPRGVRFHDTNHMGVFHAAPASKALRYCVKCHGATLAGGPLGEPSCFTCHGVKWESSPNLEATAAPADHTEQQEEWYHHGDLMTPETSCALSGCHGTNLKGDKDAATPGCLLCHDKKW
ncbi:MAG: hypothetical protein AB7T49_12050 [Oligoflexales bacterium]